MITPEAKEFYLRALAQLNITLVTESHGWAGFGKPESWMGIEKLSQRPMYIAFLAENRGEVNQFYQAAIAAGAKDNGKPEIREIYHSHYYGAFVIDPDGHNIEVVCHIVEN